MRIEFFPASNSEAISLLWWFWRLRLRLFCVEDWENANRFFFSGGVVEGDSGLMIPGRFPLISRGDYRSEFPSLEAGSRTRL